MSITSRADRKTDLAINRTGSFAAPGRYDLRKSINSTPNFTGFGTSDLRKVGPYSTTASSADMPGPGQYLSQLDQGNEQKAGAHDAAFKSTAARLAPTCPGSSAFMSSTIIFNPGPGQYSARSSVESAVKNGIRSQRIDAGIRRSKSLNRIITEKIPTTFNPPAIPSNMQTFGYVDGTEESGVRQVKPVDPPSRIITGVKSDTVGPGAYNVAKSLARNLPCSFSSSTTERRVFEQSKSIENRMPDKNNPGPGEYEGKGCAWDKGSVAGFKSKVKMAHQQSDGNLHSLIATHDKRVQSAAAAAAATAASGGPLANFGRHGEARSSNVYDSYNSGAQSQSFNTTAARDTCPKVHPYESKADQYNDRLIGPGSYNNLVSSFTHKKHKSLRKDPVGFSSTAVRDCGETAGDNDKKKSGNSGGGGDEELTIRSKSAPGPNQYNPDYYTIVKQVEKRVVGRNGVFGTTGPRFRQKIDEDMIPKPEVEQFFAGNGEQVAKESYFDGGNDYSSYSESNTEVEYDSSGFVQGGQYQNSNTSNNNRSGPRVKQMIYQSPFQKNIPVKHTSGFVVFGNGEVGNISKQRIQGVDDAIKGGSSMDGSLSEEQLWKLHQQNQNRLISGRPNGFNVSAPRGGEDYNIDGSKYQETPGPQYVSYQGNIYKPEKVVIEGSRKGQSCTFSKDRRKFAGEGGNLSLGPGSYNLPGSFSSKSFNITFKSEKKTFKRASGKAAKGGGEDSTKGKNLSAGDASIEGNSVVQ